MARDMTRKQFKEALARNGFRLVMLWIEDNTLPGASLGTTFDPHTGKMMHRSTLARALQWRRQREAEIERKGV